MIDKTLLETFIRDFKITDYDPLGRKCMWIDCLGVVKAPEEQVIARAILGAVGQFNFWEANGKVEWGKLNSDDWWSVVRGEKEIKSMNLAIRRMGFYEAAEKFISESLAFSTLKDCITRPAWWQALSAVFGGDPLHKRETLLWIMLDEMGFQCAPPLSKGCIDYNIILYMRFKGIVTGYEGNQFDLLQETMLRKECLEVIETILDKRPDITIPMLDDELFTRGRQIRHNMAQEKWNPFFCYRPGCYFY